MNKLLTLLFLSLATLQLNAQNDFEYDYPISEIYSQFTGEWTIIYSSEGMEEKKQSIKGGRGVSESKMDLNNTVLEFKTIFDYDVLKIESKMVIGYNILDKKYFIINYSSTNEPPSVLYGDYIAKKKMFIFKTYNDNPKDGDVKIELEVVRDDKLKYSSYVFNEGLENLFLSIGFLKK